MRARHLLGFGLTLPLALSGAACTAILGGFDFEGAPVGGGGSGGTTGSTIPDGGTTCEPLTQKTCYDADPGTLQGACQTGKQTCNTEGTGYGECKGQVLPAMEDDCAAMKDATCDGKLSCMCTPGSKVDCYEGPPSTKGVGNCHAGTMECNAAGTELGACVGQVMPATEQCDVAGDEDCDGVKCSEAVWATILRGNGGAALAGLRLAVDPQGNTFLSFYHEGLVDLGNGVVCADADGGCLAKVGPDGKAQWAQDLITGPIAADAQGNLYMAYQATTSGLTLASYSPAGQVQWSKSWSMTSGSVGPSAIACKSGQGVVISGGFTGGSLTFGSGPLALATPPGGMGDGFVLKVDDSNGTPVWARSVTDAMGHPGTHQGVSGVALGPTGDVFISGVYSSTVSIEGMTITTAGKLYAARLGAATGNAQWLKGFTNPGMIVPTDIAVDSAGKPVLTGQLSSGVNFGGGDLTNHGAYDVFLLKLDAGGGHDWSSLVGGSGQDGSPSVAFDSADDLVFSSEAQSPSVDVGSTMLPGPGLLLGKSTGAGSHLWNKTFGDASQYAPVVRVLPGGRDIFFAAVYWGGTVDCGTGPLSNAADGVILARFQP